MLPPRKKSSKAQRQEHDLCQPSGDQPGWGLRNQVLEEGAREKIDRVGALLAWKDFGSYPVM